MGGFRQKRGKGRLEGQFIQNYRGWTSVTIVKFCCGVNAHVCARVGACMSACLWGPEEGIRESVFSCHCGFQS